MTIISLMIYVAIAAAVLTVLVYFWKQGKISVPDSFIQNYCGALFIFSGFVKVVDPLGTAYKMEQYFQQFQAVAEGSFLKPVAGLFPMLEHASVGFSVFVIVLEIVLGIMLLVGAYRKLVVWLFFLILVFFLALTGFTYLTGYVPDGVNFFEFGKWADYDSKNMKVTDCGCFGDFLKLHPKTSFFKDVFLMLPGLWMLFRWRKLHQLFSPVFRTVLTGFSAVALTLFSFSNYIWDEPVLDFRPFKIGVNIREQKEIEKKAASEVKVSFKLKNKADGKVVVLTEDEYMKNFAQYPKVQWQVLDQIKSEPSIPETKISYFDIADLNGEDKTDSLLHEKKNTFLIISPKAKYKTHKETRQVVDSVFVYDTIWADSKKLEYKVVKNSVGTKSREEVATVYDWDPNYIDALKKEIFPVVDSFAGRSVGVMVIVGGMGEQGIGKLREFLAVPYGFYTCDDIVLKTIMRSNPGLLLLKDGVIKGKWHFKRLPEAEEMGHKYDLLKM